jgi:murein tripeptide amidase MpaA
MIKRAWCKRYTVAENVLALLSMILLVVDDVGVVGRTVGKVDAGLNGGALERCFCNRNGFWGKDWEFWLRRCACCRHVVDKLAG